MNTKIYSISEDRDEIKLITPQIETLRKRLGFMTQNSPGTIWTEYHWREAMQILQEFDRLTGKGADWNE